MRPFAIRWLVTSIAVLVVSAFPGSGIWTDGWGSLLATGLLLGVLNASVRPLLLLLSLPLIVMTMGFFVLVVNAIVLCLVGSIIPGFHVAGFGSALLSSILISLVSWPLNAFFRGTTMRVHFSQQPTQTEDEPPIKSVQGRVIR